VEVRRPAAKWQLQENLLAQGSLEITNEKHTQADSKIYTLTILEEVEF
jgi:hypothetical protein